MTDHNKGGERDEGDEEGRRAPDEGWEGCQVGQLRPDFGLPSPDRDDLLHEGLLPGVQFYDLLGINLTLQYFILQYLIL